MIRLGILAFQCLTTRIYVQIIGQNPVNSGPLTLFKRTAELVPGRRPVFVIGKEVAGNNTVLYVKIDARTGFKRVAPPAGVRIWRRGKLGTRIAFGNKNCSWAMAGAHMSTKIRT